MQALDALTLEVILGLETLFTLGERDVGSLIVVDKELCAVLDHRAVEEVQVRLPVLEQKLTVRHTGVVKRGENPENAEDVLPHLQLVQPHHVAHLHYELLRQQRLQRAQVL